MIYPIILCGGHGTRLWPISRENLPKQFIGFATETSLLQNTINRVKSLQNIKPPYILTNHNQRYLVENQLASIGIKSADIILEPQAKSTSPAITLAALHLFRSDPNGIMLVLSSDNDVTHPIRFRKIIKGSVELAIRSNKFLLFSSKPSYPEVGYGYIKSGKVLDEDQNGNSICQIDKFIEKPSLLEAEACIRDGFQWNSGIFILPLKLYIEEMQIYAPKIFEACQKSFNKSYCQKSTSYNYRINYINFEEFENCPTDSIDYALLEKTSNAAVVKSDIGWSDLGSWESIYSVQKKDSDGNVIKANSCVSINNRNTQVYSSNKTRLIAAVNLNNVTIIDSDDAVLILNTKHSQDVKKIVNSLRLDNLSTFLSHAKNLKIWGSHETLMKSGKFAVKKITINNGKKYKNSGSVRSKHFMVIDGSLLFEIGENKVLCKVNQSIIINPHNKYNIVNLSKNQKAEILKIEF